jgi:hypothetical protein
LFSFLPSRIACTCLILAFGVLLFHCKGPASETTDAVVVAPIARGGIDNAMLDATERTLVSDELGGRGSWQPGGRRAGDFIAMTLRDMGAVPAFPGGIAQPFTVRMETLRNERSYYLYAADEALTRHRVCYYPAIPASNADWEARNMVVVFPGTDEGASAHEAVVLSAHYDHQGEHQIGPLHVICYGANDNASGASIVLSVADALARRVQRPKRTVVVALFDAEEEGRRGATALLENLPPSLRDRQLLEINLDQMGSLREGALYFNDDALSPALHTMIRSVVGRHPAIVPHYEELGISSDDRNFHSAGVPAIQMTSGHYRQYHTADDGLADIIQDGMHEIAAVTLDLAVTAANGAGGWRIEAPGPTVAAAVTAWENADAALHEVRADICTALGVGSEGVVLQSGLVELTIGIDVKDAALLAALDLFGRPNDWPFAAYDQRAEALATIEQAITQAMTHLVPEAVTPALHDLEQRFHAGAQTWRERLTDVHAKQAALTAADPTAP